MFLESLAQGLDVAEAARLQQEAEEVLRRKERAAQDADCVAKMAYKGATTNGLWRASKTSDRHDPLSGVVAAKRDEAAIAGLRSAAAKADAKTQ